MSEHQFKEEALLAIPIRDNEIIELLERLAATEEMFKAPVSTIRDVAELTEASPSLIARLLGEMRGPGEHEKLSSRVDHQDVRMNSIEQKLELVGKSGHEVIPPAQSKRNLEAVLVLNYVNNVLAEDEIRQVESNRKLARIACVVVAVLTLVCTAVYDGVYSSYVEIYTPKGVIGGKN